MLFEMFYTYVLMSLKSGRWYTGSTNDLRRRLKEHNSNESKYTRKRGPYKLIYYEACENRLDAEARELYLKTTMGKRYLKNRLKCSYPT
ncbi:MAG TPA: GIY-YIG nuclease family protein [Candidatus Paceibacterota bacterium]